MPRQGTMVCIYLPRHYAQEAAKDQEVDQDARPAGTGETVLVIDDEPLVRMVVVDVLEEMGYATIEAQDGPQGLKVIRLMASSGTGTFREGISSSWST